LSVNASLATDLDEHIHKRYNDIADAILSLDAKQYPYFILKNTSCDDHVEYWFVKYDEETEEYESVSLDETDKIVAEFVVVENNEIVEFISNVDYFRDMKKEA
jgi:hypothetical protein